MPRKKPTPPQAVSFKLAIQAPPDEVYRAFTHPTLLRDWLSDAADCDARPGGRLYLWWRTGYYASGEYLRLAPGKRIVFHWHGRGEPAFSTVTVALRARRDGRTALRLTHSGLGRGRKWTAVLDEILNGWDLALENLQSVLETGVDLRTARLPRMGIGIDEFNADIAKKLGVPVKAGVRLAGVAPGTGAEAAGLQADDVLVRLGGTALKSYDSLQPALRGRQAGEWVPVVFYRGQEKHTVKMQLSARPLPDYPPTGGELAEVVRPHHAAVEAQFAQHAAGLTEAQAEVRPAPGEWNFKELIAHFIATERELQSWMANMLRDNVTGDSQEFRPNVDLRLRALVARHQTVPALLAELKLAHAETAYMLAGLPPEFVSRRQFYHRIAGWVTTTTPTHLPDEHGAQVQATLAAARAGVS